MAIGDHNFGFPLLVGFLASLLGLTFHSPIGEVAGRAAFLDISG
jgi:hypothetical protein